jgi:hypothetical protein
MPLPSFTCPCCGMISWNGNDIEQGYCGACHWWTADPALGPPHLQAPCAARDLRAHRGYGLFIQPRGPARPA